MPDLQGRIKPNSVSAAGMQAFQQEAMKKMQAVPRADLVRYHVGELNNYSAYAGVDLPPRLHELRMPTLVVNGADGLLVPTGGVYHSASHIPNAEIKIIPEAGHGLMGWPGATEAITAFLAKVAPVAAGVR